MALNAMWYRTPSAAVGVREILSAELLVDSVQRWEYGSSLSIQYSTSWMYLDKGGPTLDENRAVQWVGEF
jgi:hypothetical protein